MKNPRFDKFRKFLRIRRAEKAAATPDSEEGAAEPSESSDIDLFILILRFSVPLCFISVLLVVTIAVAPLAWIGLGIFATSLYFLRQKTRITGNDSGGSTFRVLKILLLTTTLAGLGLVFFDLNRNGSELKLKIRVLFQKFSDSPTPQEADEDEKHERHVEQIRSLSMQLYEQTEKFFGSDRLAENYPLFLRDAQRMLDSANSLNDESLKSSAQWHYDCVKREAIFYKESFKTDPAYQRAFPELMPVEATKK